MAYLGAYGSQPYRQPSVRIGEQIREDSIFTFYIIGLSFLLTGILKNYLKPATINLHINNLKEVENV
jgi:hypothetical protein